MIYKLTIFTLLTAALFGASGCSSSGENTSVKSENNSAAANNAANANAAPVKDSSSNKDSSKFLIKAVQDGVAEIQICELALKQADSADVKKFAQDMITQHGQIDREAAGIAAQKNIALPTEVSAKQKATFEEMKKLSGKSFDKKFMEHNVSDHQNDVKDYKEQMEQGTDADIKAFAAKTLTTLQTHLGYSTEINNKVKS